MKKIKNVVLILALFMCFNRCERNLDENTKTTTNQQFTIEQAQAIYGLDREGQFSLKSGSIEKARIGIKPDWCDAFTSQNDQFEVVEVNLLMQGRFDISDEESYKEWIKTKDAKMVRSLTRMVFQKNKTNGQVDNFLMTIVGNKDYKGNSANKLADNTYLNREKNFSGNIYFFDLNGNFVNGWIYEKGKVVGITNLVEGDGLATKLKMATTCITTTVYTTYVDCTDWYADSNHNGKYDPGIDQYTNTTCGDPYTVMASYTECPVFVTGGGTFGYDYKKLAELPPCNCLTICPICHKCKDDLVLKSASTDCTPWPVCRCEPAPAIEFTKVFQNNSKLMCIYSNLIGTAARNFNPLVTTFLTNFSDNVAFNPGDVTFDIGDITDDSGNSIPGATGDCKELSGNKYQITVDQDNISNRSSIEIAKTMMHEILHAKMFHSELVSPSGFFEMLKGYIGATTGNYETDQHLLMNNYYLEPMIKFLKNYDSNNGYSAPDEYYCGLALSGLNLNYTDYEKTQINNAMAYFRNRGLNCE